jgi:biotin carboxyl carrier protein
MPEELDVIRHALKVARERGFAQVDLEFGETEFSAKLAAHASKPLQRDAEAASSVDSGLTPITAPVVGYYRDGVKPLAAGSQIQKGTIVAVVAALGLANDVESPVTGEVVEVLVKANDPVEFGQPLALVRSN